MSNRSMKVIVLLEPDLCIDCRFAKMATVTLESGEQQRMINCTRLDCDNWSLEDVQTIKDVVQDPEDPFEFP
jgi:hypothetical protein